MRKRKKKKVDEIRVQIYTRKTYLNKKNSKGEGSKIRFLVHRGCTLWMRKTFDKMSFTNLIYMCSVDFCGKIFVLHFRCTTHGCVFKWDYFCSRVLLNSLTFESYFIHLLVIHDVYYTLLSKNRKFIEEWNFFFLFFPFTDIEKKKFLIFAKTKIQWTEALLIKFFAKTKNKI